MVSHNSSKCPQWGGENLEKGEKAGGRDREKVLKSPPTRCQADKGKPERRALNLRNEGCFVGTVYGCPQKGSGPFEEGGNHNGKPLKLKRPAWIHERGLK